MTTRFTADIFCDRCSNWMHGATSIKSTGLATKAVKRAKAAGWSRQTNSAMTDLCPLCIKEFPRNPGAQR